MYLLMSLTLRRPGITKPYILNIIYRVCKVISLCPSQLFFALWTIIE